MKIKELLGRRNVQIILIDCVILVMTGFAAYFVSNMISFVNLAVRDALPQILISAVFAIAVMACGRAYRIIWKYANAKEYCVCIACTGVGMALSYFLSEILSLPEPSEIFMMFFCTFAIMGVLVSRIVYNYLYRLFQANSSAGVKKNVMIVGGGDACCRIMDEMTKSSSCTYKPVVIVDDDKDKLHKLINSVPVAGTTEDITRLSEKYEVDTIFFAIPSCDLSNKKRILGMCSETDCDVKVIPYIYELADTNNLLGQAQPVKVEDLLGREVVKLENPMLNESISDKVCLVTGGGGSIGSELAKQIAAHNPKKLIILDIYENNAYDIQQELKRKYGSRLDLCIQIASVRDYDKLEAVFNFFRPQLVFHAAAHKHVPLMETNPEEAVKNNIFGTFNTASLAEKYAAEKFVLVSTDKAVNPTNVMGATKRCCEMIVQHMAQKSVNTEFIAVRFGNVLGSNGSVIPLFEKQLAENKPLTVTHPDIIRYFMTIPEAASLILEAAAIAKGGEIFVLDMGEPVKILSLAENLIRLHGKRPYKDVEIKFTGLRPGEKLYEELLMDEEGLRRTENNRIFVGKQIYVDAERFIGDLTELKAYADTNDTERCVSKLSEIVPTFKHNEPQEAKSAV